METPITNQAVKLVINDGGRAAAGFTGSTGDCVTRAIAIAARRPYQEVYDLINATASRERTGKRKRGISSARSGVYRGTYEKVIASLGGTWRPLMTIGSGCTVHCRASQLPATGRHILSLSKHLASYINGELHDTSDPSRGGTRCVYGIYTFPE